MGTAGTGLHRTCHVHIDIVAGSWAWRRGRIGVAGPSPGGHASARKSRAHHPRPPLPVRGVRSCASHQLSFGLHDGGGGRLAKRNDLNDYSSTLDRLHCPTRVRVLADRLGVGGFHGSLQCQHRLCRRCDVCHAKVVWASICATRAACGRPGRAFVRDEPGEHLAVAGLVRAGVA